MPEYYSNPLAGDPRIQQSMSRLGEMLANSPNRRLEAEMAGRQGRADLDNTYARTAASYSQVGANEALGRQRAAAAALDEDQLAAVQEIGAVWSSNPNASFDDRMRAVAPLAIRAGVTPEQVEALVGLSPAFGLGYDEIDRYNFALGGDYGNTKHAFDNEPVEAFDPGTNEFTFGRQGDLVGGNLRPITSLDEQKGRVFSFLSPEAQDSTVMGLNDLVETLDENGRTVYAPEYLAMGQPVPPDPKKTPTITNWVEGNETVEGYYDPTDPRANDFGYVVVGRGPRTGRAGETLMSPADEVYANEDKATLESALVAGRDANTRIGDIDRTMALLRNGTPSGYWTDKTLPIRQAAVGLGFGDERKLGQIETLTADLGTRVMARIQETKGAVSNAEMDYFRKISASIGKTPYGNMLLLESERRVWERAAEIRAYALELRKIPGITPEEISDRLEQFKNENPIWSAEELNTLELIPDEELGLAAPDTGSPLAGLDTSMYD